MFEAGQVLVACDWEDSVGETVALFDGEPVIADEARFFIGLEIDDIDEVEIPWFVRAEAAVVMPDAKVKQVAEWLVCAH